MRIAVTGRNGQIVQSLVERAAAAKIDVHTVARPEADLARPETVEAALMDSARRHRECSCLHRGRSRRE